LCGHAINTKAIYTASKNAVELFANREKKGKGAEGFQGGSRCFFVIMATGSRTFFLFDFSHGQSDASVEAIKFDHI